MDYTNQGIPVNHLFVSADGRVASRTPYSHPYSYDPFVTFRCNQNVVPDNTVYSDRLYRWDTEKYNRLCRRYWDDEAQHFYERHPKQIEAFLRDYFGHPNLILTLIEQQCNQATGFPVWRFDYLTDGQNAR